MTTKNVSDVRNGFGAARWLPFVGVALATVGVAQGCTTLVDNPNYCAARNIDGNQYCAVNHPDGSRPYCMSGETRCLNRYEMSHDVDYMGVSEDFDGCVGSKPEAGCYSPCGDRQISDYDSACPVEKETDLETTWGSSGIGDATDGSEWTSEGHVDSTSSTSSSSSSGSEASTSSSEPPASTSDDNGTCVQPPPMWKSCLDGNGNLDIEQQCGNNEADCFMAPSGYGTHSACSLNCDDECDCPTFAGGTTLTCDYLPDGDPQKDCYLDCSGGLACPQGMECVSGYICMATHVPVYSNCHEDACGTDVQEPITYCLIDPDIDPGPAMVRAQVCSVPCGKELPDCPPLSPAAEDSSASVECGDIAGDAGAECYLDCSNDPNGCPEGMICIEGSVTTGQTPWLCIWQ